VAGDHEVGRAAGAEVLEVLDRGRPVGRVVAGVVAGGRLREVPPAPAGQLDERLVAARDDEHLGVGGQRRGRPLVHAGDDLAAEDLLAQPVGARLRGGQLALERVERLRRGPPRGPGRPPRWPGGGRRRLGRRSSSWYRRSKRSTCTVASKLDTARSRAERPSRRAGRRLGELARRWLSARASRA
jgi:hypothetical protein